MTNFRLFQTERDCRRQFQFEENGKKSSQRVENTVGEGEITCYEHSVFKRLILQTHKNQGLFGKGLTLSHNPHILI